MRRGPTPSPPALELLRGRPGRRRAGKGPPEIPAACPEPPDALSVEARAEWEKILPALTEYGIVTVLDGAVLGIYCTLRAQWRELQSILHRDGLMLTRAGGPIPHPALKASLDTAARCRLKIAGLPAPKSKIQEFLERHDRPPSSAGTPHRPRPS